MLTKEDVNELVFTPINQMRKDHIYDHFVGISRLVENMVILMSIQCRY